MADLNESTVRSIIRAEIGSLASDIRRDITKLESRISELHSLQSDVHRTLSSVDKLLSQTTAIANVARGLQNIQLTMDELRTRAQHTEESSRYTAGYVAMRLKERYEKPY